MKTNNNIQSTININEMIAHAEKVLNVCNKEIEHLTHPEVYGCCLDRCNSIVINKERLMTVTTDETRHTTYEFTPLYPTYFSPEAADRIVASDIYKDNNGNRIALEIVGKLEYYQLLKEYSEKSIGILKSIEA